MLGDNVLQFTVEFGPECLRNRGQLPLVLPLLVNRLDLEVADLPLEVDDTVERWDAGRLVLRLLQLAGKRTVGSELLQLLLLSLLDLVGWRSTKVHGDVALLLIEGLLRCLMALLGA